MIVLRNTTDAEVIVNLTLFREVGENDNSHEIPKSEQQFWAENPDVVSNIADGTLMLVLNGEDITDVAKAISILNNTDIKTVSAQNQAFSDKRLTDGKKLFKRVHGVKKTLATNEDTIEFIVPYTMSKISGIEILGADHGDTANFNVYDNAAGTISTIPNYKLNQFGFDVCLAKDFHKETSSYDADLILGMKLEVGVTSTAGKVIGVNFILHEVK